MVDLFTGLERQLEAQRDRARFLIRERLAGRVRLVRVEYCDLPPGVSIIGHTISEAAIELWRAQGAAVVTIEELNGNKVQQVRG